MPYSKEFILFLKDVIDILKANISDLKERKLFAESEEKEYISARLFSYHEIITTLRSQLREYNISEEEIGLNEIDPIV
jgi:hypothetical protein